MEYIIGGHTGFIFLDKDGNPKVAMHLEHAMKRMMDKYNATHAEPMKVTPHVLRHTFCTNMAQADIQPKALQYIMGHADIAITLGTYTHYNYDAAQAAFQTAKTAP